MQCGVHDCLMKRRKKDYAVEVARRIKQRRGQGAGAYYRPWLTVRDARRGGIRHRVPSIFGDRNHHLLSNNELHWFHLWSLCPGVVEIREQYQSRKRACDRASTLAERSLATSQTRPQPDVDKTPLGAAFDRQLSQRAATHGA